MSAKAASKVASTAAASSSRPFRILALPLVRLPRASHSATASSASPAATPTQSTLDPNPPSAPTAPGHAASSSSTSASAAPSGKAAGAAGKSNAPLMLYQVLQPPASTESGPPSLVTRALNKASETWLKIGERPKDSWMYWFYSKGESLMDRIEYEEWSLKGIHEGRGIKVANKEKGETQERIEIALLHPQFKEAPLPTLVPKLHRMLIHRIPYHRKMMWRSILFSPATWPFALIPVIPNFPLFYVLWRAWSHYKAWRGALYLEQLLKLGMIVEKPSESLTEIYETKGASGTTGGEENLAPDHTSTPTSSSNSSKSSTTTTTTESTPAPDPTAQGEKNVPPQAAGKRAAPDGTTTPSEMVYPSSTSTSTSASSSSSSGTTASASTAAKPSAKGSKARHPNLLLRPDQVPLLTKAFGLKQTEIIDINRAVEQANIRAKKAAQAEAEAKGEKEEGQEPSTNWRGNLHR